MLSIMSCCIMGWEGRMINVGRNMSERLDEPKRLSIPETLMMVEVHKRISVPVLNFFQDAQMAAML